MRTDPTIHTHSVRTDAADAVLSLQTFADAYSEPPVYQTTACQTVGPPCEAGYTDVCVSVGGTCGLCPPETVAP